MRDINQASEEDKDVFLLAATFGMQVMDHEMATESLAASAFELKR